MERGTYSWGLKETRTLLAFDGQKLGVVFDDILMEVKGDMGHSNWAKERKIHLAWELLVSLLVDETQYAQKH